MPLVNMVFGQFDHDTLYQNLASKMQVYVQSCGNDEFFTPGIFQTEDHANGPKTSSMYSQRVYINDNHFALDEISHGSNNIPMNGFTGRFAKSVFEGQQYPRLEWDLDCESDDSCKIIVTYPATAELVNPVHFGTTNQKIPELWVAQSAVSNFKPPYAPVQLPNGRDFRFMDALNMNILMKGGQPSVQDVQYAPGALGPGMNAEMSVRNGNLVWEYTIPTPEN